MSKDTKSRVEVIENETFRHNKGGISYGQDRDMPTRGKPFDPNKSTFNSGLAAGKTPDSNGQEALVAWREGKKVTITDPQTVQKIQQIMKSFAADGLHPSDQEQLALNTIISDAMDDRQINGSAKPQKFTKYANGPRGIETDKSSYIRRDTNGGGVDFRTDLDKRDPSVTMVNTFLSAGKDSEGNEVVRVAMRNKGNDTIYSKHLSDQVKTALNGFMADTIITPLEEAKSRYMVSDILDDHKLNGSAPNNPNPTRRQR